MVVNIRNRSYPNGVLRIVRILIRIVKLRHPSYPNSVLRGPRSATSLDSAYTNTSRARNFETLVSESTEITLISKAYLFY